MPTTLGAIIQFANINFDGVNCSECDQIAFMVAEVVGNGVVYEVPLCGRHYIEAQRIPKVSASEGASQSLARSQ
jgi:hypothetical protein